MGDYPPKIDETNNNNELRVLPEVIIPEYIIVHDGIPTNSNAKNYIVSFPDYIKMLLHQKYIVPGLKKQ